VRKRGCSVFKPLENSGAPFLRPNVRAKLPAEAGTVSPD
jgi:hypothetical protein